MSELKEKTAYLKGLIEGLDFAQDPKQKLVWEGLVQFCELVADELDDLGDSQDEFAQYIEAIDEDLSSLEQYFYNAEPGEDEPESILAKEPEDEPVIEMTCPYCKEKLFFEDEEGEYEVICPECGNKVWDHFVTEANPQVDHPEVH